jgi:hypothetical protein
VTLRVISATVFVPLVDGPRRMEYSSLRELAAEEVRAVYWGRW